MNRYAIGLLLFMAGTCAPVALAGQAQSSTPSTTPHNTVRAHPASGHATDPALLHPALLKARAPDVYEVKFATTKGDFVVHVTRAWAPLGADRFYNLVKHGFFTNASFFRVVPGFVVQFGISADPKISALWDNADIKDDPVHGSNKPGTVTFATGGPNTRTTQVFINLRDNSNLDGMGFAPIGEVTSGMDVVTNLYSGYGDLPEMGGRGPSEEAISKGGQGYLEKNFPMLDRITSATMTSPAGSAASGAAPGHKPAASSTKPTSSQ